MVAKIIIIKILYLGIDLDADISDGSQDNNVFRIESGPNSPINGFDFLFKPIMCLELNKLYNQNQEKEKEEEEKENE